MDLAHHFRARALVMNLLSTFPHVFGVESCSGREVEFSCSTLRLERLSFQRLHG